VVPQVDKNEKEYHSDFMIAREILIPGTFLIGLRNIFKILKKSFFPLIFGLFRDSENFLFAQIF